MYKQQDKIKVIFINPPHADWSLSNNLAYLSMQSFFNRHSNFFQKVQWLPAPYKWNQYQSIDEIISIISEADIILYSSYIWNYQLLDEVSKKIKEVYPEKINLLGGAHIGLNDPKFLKTRNQYDYICQATKPGEIFVYEFLEQFFQKDSKFNYENLSWEIRSKKRNGFNFNYDYSIYEDHLEYLKESFNYSVNNNLEPFITLETTRGCPYSCSFCEWGGGTGTKILKRSLEWVKRDILAIKEAGFDEIYMADANFGVFLERDVEIFQFAWDRDILLTDISTVKTPRLSARKKLVDMWFDVVGNKREGVKNSERSGKLKGLSYSIVPTVSLQSASETAMKVAKRVDLNFQDKLKLSEHINKRCEQEGFPIPALELILGMPGSTLDDFYNEMNIIWNFKAWKSYRHDYLFLPDADISKESYLKKYQITLTEVFSDISDEDGVDNLNSLYSNRRIYFKTISSCYSFSSIEMMEMWFMNFAGNYLLKNLYPKFETYYSAAEFCRESFLVIYSLPQFREIWEEIKNIFNPNTKPSNIKRIHDKYRVDSIEELLFQNKLFIINGLMSFVQNIPTKEVVYEL